ncbi:DUF2497 domain-containing protein [Marinicauda algicola]|uniref:DUF2497 domain-containing protein n=1 Tax=Marinicauda algicola TaxID=2029849 RepID=A0A4S2GYY3_9PROT|nr:DUF2497 domain-containing protein [Marinicauda algicola]TGY88395.1 DUF2497 domain-containing protein [Marinicauda algicola]
MANAEQEPTMEEILASIRRIINEDEDEAKPAEAEAAPEPVEEPEPESEDEVEFDAEPEFAEDESEPAEDDVLELTDRVEDETAGTDPISIADDLMIVDREEEEMQAEPEEEPEPEPEPAPRPQAKPAASAPAEEEELLGEVQASAASSAFAALSGALKVSSDQGLTLEGIVRELLRPMLKQWLDENLPAIVEEKVEAEIERVARRRR